MPATVYKSRSNLGVATRRGDPHEIENARRNLAESKIQAFIERTLAAAPPLTVEQRTRLAALLAPAVGGDFR